MQLGSKYATNLSIKTPKMLSWTSNQVLQAKDVVEDLKKKKKGYFMLLVRFMLCN